MEEPGIPSDEWERQRALEQLQVLDTAAEDRFDRYTRLAQNIFAVPIALVSLIDKQRQWFKSRQGLQAEETPRKISFCGHAILGDVIFQVPDTLEDPRFVDNPLVTGPPNIRMYTGAPLVTADGYRVGTLCIIDEKPRHFTETEQHILRDLADCVQDELNRILIDHATLILRDRESFLRALLDTVVEAIVVIDDAGVIRKTNPAIAGMFGFSSQELIDKPAAILIPKSEHYLISDYLGHYRATGRARIVAERETIGLRKTGELFPLQLSISSMVQGNRTFFIAVLRDITERKRAEMQLVEAKQKADESNRIKSEFLNVMSHELRTPLTVLLGYLPILRRSNQLPSAEEIRAMASDMQVSGNHLLQLINDMLDLSKIEAGKLSLNKERCSLQQIVAEVVQNLAHKAEEKGIVLRSEILPEIQVNGDPLRLRQVFYNLLGNAIKFTSQGSVRIKAGVDDEHCVIDIIDTGMGIAEQDLPFIFDKFHQVDSSRKRQAGGTGLGLAITQRLVNMHDGSIQVRSQLGQGTCMTLSLPCDSR